MKSRARIWAKTQVWTPEPRKSLFEPKTMPEEKKWSGSKKNWDRKIFEIEFFFEIEIFLRSKFFWDRNFFEIEFFLRSKKFLRSNFFLRSKKKFEIEKNFEIEIFLDRFFFFCDLKNLKSQISKISKISNLKSQVKGIGGGSYTSERSERMKRAKRKTPVPSTNWDLCGIELACVGDQNLSQLLQHSSYSTLRPGLCRLDCSSSNMGPLDQTIPRLWCSSYRHSYWVIQF